VEPLEVAAVKLRLDHVFKGWNMKRILIALAIASIFAGGAMAQTPPQPPAKGIKLSEIISKIEGRDKFQYVYTVEWSTSGYYIVTYFTSDKAKVEIKLDPVTGETK
jgi:hypothetical protein